MENKEVTIEGPVVLKEAIVKEVGWKLLSGDSIIGYKYLSPCENPGYPNTFQGSNSHENVHFVLPKDWNIAVNFIKNFYKEEDIRISIYKAEFYTDCNNCNADNYVKFGCHEITLTELQALKTVIELCDRLDYDITCVTKTSIFPSGNSDRVLSLEVINKLIERLTK